MSTKLINAIFKLAFLLMLAASARASDVVLLSESKREIVVEFNLRDYQIDSVQINGQPYVKFNAENCQSTSKPGWPQLPQISKWIRVASENIRFEILEDDLHTVAYGLPIPVAETLFRNNPHQLTYLPRPEFYEQGATFPEESFDVSLQGKAAHANLALLTFYPAQFNLQTAQWTLHTRVKVKISWQAARGLDNSTELPQPYVSRSILNPDVETAEPDTSAKLLIVTEQQFFSSLQPFIDWKKQCGIPARIFIYSEIAQNALELKNYLTAEINAFETPPEYLLFVGDVQLIPAFYGVGGSLTDHPYSCLNDGDYLPDISVGRMPCATAAECSEWTEKIIHYERDGFTNENFRGTVFSSNVSLDPQHGIYVSNMFSQAGMSQVSALQQPASGSLGELMNALNLNNQWIFYIGHGLSQAWSSVTPHFENQHLMGSSAESSPIVVSVACATADLDYPVRSLAEAWVNLESSSSALAYVGATETTPFYYSDTLGIGALRAIFLEQIDRIGPAVDYGRLAASLAFPQQSGGLCEETIQQFVLLGDPSMRVYSNTPSDLTVIHPSGVPLSLEQFTVTVQQNGVAQTNVTVCISSQTDNSYYQILQTNSSGQAIFEFEFSAPQRLLLTVTCRNARVYQSSVNVFPSEGPFIVLGSHSINDLTGDGDGYADRGEACMISYSLINCGNSPSAAGIFRVFCDDSRISPLNESIAIQSIAPQDTLFLNPVAFTVSNDAADLSSVLVSQTVMFDSNQTSEFVTPLVLHAPTLEYLFCSVSEDSGDGDGRTENGETGIIELSFQNVGTEDARNITAELALMSEEITQLSNLQSADRISSADTISLRYSFRIANLAQRGFALPLRYDLSGTNFSSFTGQDTIRINQIPVLLFVQDQMPEQVGRVEGALNALGIEYERVTVLPQNLMRYRSLWIFSGIYPNAVPLSQVNAQRIANYLDNSGSCYWEGGDVWAFDPTNSLRPYFHIQGITDGSANAGPIVGEYGTYYQNYSFTYSGENNFIDQLAPVDGSHVILRNNRVNASYPTAIAYANSVYRTIGSSVETGFLSNTDNPSQRVLFFAEMLEWLGISISVDLNPPVITHTPITVYHHANENIAISADIQDPGGVQSAYLEYRVNNGNAIMEPMLLSNGLYRAQIHGAPFGTVIYYRIHAVDSTLFQNEVTTDEFIFSVESLELVPCDVVFSEIASIAPNILGEQGSWTLTNYPENTPVLELHSENNQAISWVSDKIVCSNLSDIHLTFWNYMRTASDEDGTVAEIVGSTDDGRTFPHKVWSRTQNIGGILEEGWVKINNTSWMNRQNSVKLKFSFYGKMYWRLRDVQVRADSYGESVKDLVIQTENQSISLRWKPVENALSYLVSASNSLQNSNEFKILASTKNTYFSDSTAQNEQMRFYRVQAVLEQANAAQNTQSRNQTNSPVVPALLREADLRWNSKMSVFVNR